MAGPVGRKHVWVIELQHLAIDLEGGPADHAVTRDILGWKGKGG